MNHTSKQQVSGKTWNQIQEIRSRVHHIHHTQATLKHLQVSELAILGQYAHRSVKMHHILPNSKSWHSRPLEGKAGSSTELSFL